MMSGLHSDLGLLASQTFKSLKSFAPQRVLYMRVAIVHALFEVVGGDARLALDMYRALRGLGHEVDLYTAHVNEDA